MSAHVAVGCSLLGVGGELDSGRGRSGFLFPEARPKPLVSSKWSSRRPSAYLSRGGLPHGAHQKYRLRLCGALVTPKAKKPLFNLAGGAPAKATPWKLYRSSCAIGNKNGAVGKPLGRHSEQAATLRPTEGQSRPGDGRHDSRTAGAAPRLSGHCGRIMRRRDAGSRSYFLFLAFISVCIALTFVF